jgi:nitroreductase
MRSYAGRTADHDIDPLFLQRWSPRAFTGEPIPESELARIFEAARWAPSSSNAQPWRFLYARRDTPPWPKFLGLLSPTNQAWAQHTAVLIVAVSQTTRQPSGGGPPRPSHSHSFDCGAAWLSMALQATAMGWHAHGMAGFDIPRAAIELNVPADYRVEAAIAIGRHGNKSALPEAQQAREAPNGREPISSFTFEGGFRK